MKPQDANPKNKFLISLSAIFLLGILVRLGLSYFFQGTYDVMSYEKVWGYWREGLSPYDGSFRYNYCPLWFNILSTLNYLNGFLQLPAHFLIKLPLILSDLGTTVVLIYLVKSAGGGEFRQGIIAALFFLNPVSFFSTAYHGQVDAICLFFIVLACLVETSRYRQKAIFSALLVAIAVAMKHSFVIAALCFIFQRKSWKTRALYFAASSSVFLISSAPYLLWQSRDFFDSLVFKNPSLNLPFGYFGWTVLLRLIVYPLTGVDISFYPSYAWISHLNIAVYMGIIVSAYYFSKKINLINCLFLVFLFFYVFSVILAPQYLLWILPFAVFKSPKYFLAYSLLATAYLLTFYYVHHFFLIAAPLPEWSAVRVSGNVIKATLWFLCVIWFVSSLKKSSENQLEKQLVDLPKS